MATLMLGIVPENAESLRHANALAHDYLSDENEQMIVWKDDLQPVAHLRMTPSYAEQLHHLLGALLRRSKQPITEK